MVICINAVYLGSRLIDLLAESNSRLLCLWMGTLAVKKIARTVGVACFLSLIAACVGDKTKAQSSAPRRDVDYSISWVDMPRNQNFSVRLESLSRREICTGSGRWSTSTGYIGGSGLKIFVHVDGKLFKYRDSNMEMCLFRECENPMSRGSVLQSVLTYEGFELPEELWSVPKELEFDPEPYWCINRR